MNGWVRIEGTQFMRPPEGKVTCPICHMGDFTGYVDVNNGRTYPSDMNDEVHDGFTIGKKGRTLYWMMLWHGSGHVTVINKDATYRRWLEGDTEITIHWKNLTKLTK